MESEIDLLVSNVKEIDLNKEQKIVILKRFNITFNDLPEYVQLYIFSFLHGLDLLKISTVSRWWYYLASDELLWKKKLKEESQQWIVVTSTSRFVDEIEENNEDKLTCKQIYKLCCPHLNTSQYTSTTHSHNKENNRIHQYNFRNSIFQLISRFIYTPFTTPSPLPLIAILGPGLERGGGNRLIKNMFRDDSKEFSVMSMFPGTTQGFGTGLSMILKKKESRFNLLVLYSVAQSQRETQDSDQRFHSNRMFCTNEENDEIALREPLMKLWKTLNGSIYVIDAGSTLKDISISLIELSILCNENISSIDVPILLLLCSKNYNTTDLTCLELAQQLHLLYLRRPWRIHRFYDKEMHGIDEAFHWIIETSKKTIK